MYYTEKIVYLQWNEYKQPRDIRSRSSSPTMLQPQPHLQYFTRTPSPEPTKHSRRYISIDQVKELTDFEEDPKMWTTVTEEYIKNALHVINVIPNKVISVFMSIKNHIVFKVISYELDLETIKKQLGDNIKLSIPIAGISTPDKYVANPNTTTIRVTFDLSHISIFRLTGRDSFGFSFTLNELDECNRMCFNAFRNLCRSEKVLTELFEKSISQYFDSSREHVGNIIRDYLESENK